MKFTFSCVMFLLMLLTACYKTQKVRFDPYYLNYNIKVKDIKRAGYQLNTTDHGVCMYAQDKEYFNPILIFYGSTDDICKSIEAQEFNITFGENVGRNFDESKGRIITPQDSINFLKILKPYGTISISGIHNLNLCTAKFYGKNKEGVIIEWTASNICSDGIILSTYAKIN